MSRALRSIVLAACAGTLLPSAESADDDESPDFGGETLTGDWGGRRSGWYRQGAHVELGYKLDVVRNQAGGLDRGTRVLGLFEPKLRLDADKLWGIAGGTAYFHLVSSLGGKPNAALTGSAMGIDNQEVATNTTKFFHAWYEQTLWDDRVSILAGLYPIDSEFYVTSSSGVFLHPSFGMSAEIAATGKSGPSIFPTSAFGVRLKLQPDPAYYAQLAVLDGVPGSETDPRGTHLHFRRGDGAMAIAEFGWRPAEKGHPDEPTAPEKGLPVPPEQKAEEKYEPTSKYAVGIWRYNPLFDDFVDTDANGQPVRRRSHGAYLIAERTLFQERKDPSQGLAAFVRYGVADASVNPISDSVSLGISYKGLIDGRDADEFGFAATRARASDKFRQANSGLDASETAIEMTYRARVRPWLAIQPAVQHIHNPGFDPALKDAWVIQVRFEAAL